MPIAHKERNPSDVDLGNVSVNIPPPNEVNASIAIQETTGAFSVAAGKLKVEILNMGFVVDGDLEVAATVNGQSLEPGTPPLIFEAVEDPAAQEFKTTPAISGNGNGARLRITTTE